MNFLDLCESTADIYTVTLTKDKAGGRDQTFALSQSALPCSIQPGDTSRTTDHGQEGQASPFDVLFASDPGVRVNDQIRPTGSTRILVVVGKAADQASSGVCWSVPAVERKA